VAQAMELRLGQGGRDARGGSSGCSLGDGSEGREEGWLSRYVDGGCGGRFRGGEVRELFLGQPLAAA